LSENAAFSQAAIDVSITWLGPTPSVMKTMGLKHLARAGAMESDVICVPGSTGLVSDEAAALEVASRIGYPAMLKASAAGWGMGNGDGICEDESALWDAFAGVTKRAQVRLCTLD
jgi:acetyl/propionyl-CoA carboxylase alpha subunit